MPIHVYCPKCGVVPYPGPCQKCALEKRRRRSRTPQQKMYAGVGQRGREWRSARAAYIAAHPTCEWEGGCIAPSEHVHHRDGDPLGPRGLDPLNFQGLCLSHHSQKTAAEHPGWNAR